MSKLDELTRAAREASEVRGYQTDPDVVALRIERIRGWCDRLVWAGIILGLLFTCANVQHFAAGTHAHTPWTPGAWKDGTAIDWIIAWSLDPMVSLVLIGVLMGEQVINRHGITAGGWVRITKWVALGCTYSMNTWAAWDSKDPASILLHSVPPVIVVCATEAIPTLRRQITEAVMKAYQAAVSVGMAVESTSIPAVVDAKGLDAGDHLADEVNTDDWPDTPEELDRWLPVPEDQRVPEPQVHVPDAVPQDVPDLPETVEQPVPDPQHVAAADLFSEEVQAGRVPGIGRIRKALGIGQERAYAVQSYLKTLATE